MKKTLALIPSMLLAVVPAKAHCPLCTAGAGAAAAGASWLGVNMAVVGVLIGGFALSMGWWIANLIKKKYFKGQDVGIIIATFLVTIIPIIPIVNGAMPITISLTGDYGSLLNRTYMVDGFLLGSILGGILVSIAPSISKKISEYRKETIPFQGMALTISMLIVTALIVQVIL